MAHALREKAAISGVGDTAYTPAHPRAARAAARGQPQGDRRRGAQAPRHRRPHSLLPRRRHRRDFVANLGLPDLTLSLFVPMGGATCVAAIQSAAMAVATGVCRNVLISVGRTAIRARASAPGCSSSRNSRWPRVRGADRHVRAGPALCPRARRHMQLYGTTPRHFAESRW